MGQTYLDLAELARAQRNAAPAATCLKRAHNLFRALGVPKYAERTERLAREFRGPHSEGSVPGQMGPVCFLRSQGIKHGRDTGGTTCSSKLPTARVKSITPTLPLEGDTSNSRVET